MIHAGLFVAFLSLVSIPASSCTDTDSTADDCSVGDLYVPQRARLTSLNGWYLNIEHPSSCSGNVTALSMHYYVLPASNSCVWWALFEPIGGREYVQIPNTLNSTCRSVSFDGTVYKTFQTDLPGLPVLTGSVVGVYITSGLESLTVIGNLDIEPPVYTQSRLCRATGAMTSNHSTPITCIPLSKDDLALHLQMDIRTIECPDDNYLINGYYYHDGREYGSTVHYTCFNDFRLVGISSRTCQANGEWSGPNPTCTIVECPELSNPENGLVVLDDGPFFGSTAFFYCNAGFTLEGVIATSCSANGEWTDPIPTCLAPQRQCPSIPIIPNGRYIPSEIDTFSFGEQVHFYCDSNFILVGSSVLTCTIDSEWNREFPSCVSSLSSTELTSFVNPSLTTDESTKTESTAISSLNSCPQSLCTTDITVTTHSHFSQAPLFTSITVQLFNTSAIDGNNNMKVFSLNLEGFIIIVVISSAVILGFVILTICLCVRILKRKVKVSNNIKEEELQYSVPIDAITTNINPEVISIETNGYEYLTDCQDYSEYEEPAGEETQLYMQLDRIKVKKIQRQDLLILGPLGSGQFGNVHYCVWDCNNSKINVAVKTLQEQSSEKDKLKFLQEATIMGQFQHNNVLNLHGLVQDNSLEEIMLVVELMVKGDLKSFLRNTLKNRITAETPKRMLGFCRQICEGMCYLSRKGYVHRDLAARNILVSADYCCKISDFGMSRDLEDGYYLAQRGGVIPFKWTAPEAINFRKYSTASDVWSYGCLLYEIWSLGCRPFGDEDSRRVLMKLERGYRLPPPPGCPKSIYEIMISTWHPEPKERPSFPTIITNLLRRDEELLSIPDRDKDTQPKAGIIGGPLDAGHCMYKALQNSYSYYFTMNNINQS